MGSDVEAARRGERAYLACILTEGRDVRLDGLTDAMFATPFHRTVHVECEAMTAAGTPVDLVTVGSRLAATGKMPKGGWAALSAILDEDYWCGNVEAYAEIVRAQAFMRRQEARGGRK